MSPRVILLRFAELGAQLENGPIVNKLYVQSVCVLISQLHTWKL